MKLELTEEQRCFLGNAVITFRENYSHLWKDNSRRTADQLLSMLLDPEPTDAELQAGDDVLIACIVGHTKDD